MEEEEEEEVRTDVADMEAESQQVRMLQLRGTYVHIWFYVACSSLHIICRNFKLNSLQHYPLS